MHMSQRLLPLHLMFVMFADWVNRHQLDVSICKKRTACSRALEREPSSLHLRRTLQYGT